MKPCDPCYWLYSFPTKQIAAQQSKISKSLFKPPINDEISNVNKTINLVLKSLINSKSFEQFQSDCKQILIDSFTNNSDKKTNNFDDFLWISVVFFSIFMRCNFVGPFELTEYEINEWDKWCKYELFKNEQQLTSLKCHEWLRIDNEDIEFELKYPFLLILSTIILQNGLFYLNNHQNKNNENNQTLNNNISWNWWYVRVLRYHQNILSNRCPSIQNKILSQCKIIENLFPQSFTKLNDIKQQINNNKFMTLKQLLQCQFNIEYTLIAKYYWKHDIAENQMKSAKQCLSDSFIYEMTSKLGKRTKWQIDSKPQLLLTVKSSIYPFFPSPDIIDDIEEKENEQNDNDNKLLKQQKHFKKTWYLPINIPLEDDTLLDQIKWDDADDDKTNNMQINDDKLHYLEYCILLYESIQHGIINKVKGISEINILAYIDRLNLNGNIHDWSVQILVLLQRCRTEFSNYNKQTRAIQQYESITYHLNSLFDEARFFPTKYIGLKTHVKLKGVKMSDNDNNKDNKIKKEKLNKEYNELCAEIGWKRLRGIYGTTLKSHSQIQCELGDLYIGLGFTQSALAIYEKLKHFHKVATCLVNLGRKHDAKEMLLKQIKQIDLMENKNKNDDENDDGKVTISHHYSLDRKPYYLCLLGDITDDITYYEEAWNVSNKTYGRAMRTLSYHYYHKQKYGECIECARKALSINSLFPKVWFLLGSAAMEIKPYPIYEYVIEAFTFVVSIDAIDFEAWNNLGAAHMNLKNYKSALYALNEAGNLRRDNWRIWENILTCSLKLKNLSQSIAALTHLIDIKKDTMSINPNIIAALTIELTNKIQKYQLQNKNVDITDPDIDEEQNDGDNDMKCNDDDVQYKQKEIDIMIDFLKKDENETKSEEKKDDDYNMDEMDTKIEEEVISETTMILLIKQFDKLIVNILNRLNEHSFIGGSSHHHQSPFTKTGLDNDTALSGISQSKREKQSQYAYDIYEIFSIYFEKSLRIEECIETRFKHSRMIMKYFENICRNGQSDKIKDGYLKVIHVLSRLTYLYSLQINIYRNDKNGNKNDNKLDIKKLEQMLTSIQLILNRAQKLSDKMYIDLKENKELIINLQKMEKLIYKIKNDEETQKAKNQENEPKIKESVMSAFSDWM